jgi:hypothetical protein
MGVRIKERVELINMGSKVEFMEELCNHPVLRGMEMKVLGR